ncbi:MAG: hypothetical protein JW384_03685 [Nitrosomonadaceae bacterium]|nr:hypothetical protein [Nitrosomonadaceae bacterium]
MNNEYATRLELIKGVMGRPRYESNIEEDPFFTPSGNDAMNSR